MYLKLLNLSVIILLSLFIFSGTIGTTGFSQLGTNERISDIPTAPNDSDAAIGIDQESSLEIGQNDQELVKVTNNMKSQKETTVQLESGISWQISDSEGPSRILNPSDSTTYSVDTSQVSSSRSEGTYVIKMLNGSFLISAERTVILENPDLLASEQTILYHGLNALNGNGSDSQALDPKNVKALGPPSLDLTGNGLKNVPYVDNSGTLRITDGQGNNKTLVAKKPKPASKKTLMSVGSWKGSPASVFFANSKNDAIYRVDGNGNTVQVATPSNGVQAVSGFGDIDDDGAEELIFADGSQQLRYLEDNGNTKKISGGGLGSSSGIGAGPPPDLNNNGIPRVVGVDGSNNIKIVGVAEPTLTITGVNAAKSPVTTADIDGDAEDEIIYIGNQNQYIKFVDNPLSGQQIKTVRNSQGDPIVGESTIGIVSG
jgi:hypothetical protein